jgi:hypothetical protein
MKHILLFITIILVFCSCRQDNHDEGTHSMYYWSTTFSMDSTKTNFMNENKVKKLYIRYFDVVTDASGKLMPNATISFQSRIPRNVEVVPTVFIVNECMYRNNDSLAQKILKRILQMDETNDIYGVKEIQIDCDWTLKTEKKYFDFLAQLRQLTKEKGLSLSATIRLHQLAQSVPPVDRGILMMYNTGDFTDFNCKRPILDMKDVAPYLKHIGRYGLSLSAAYPIFSWKLLFRGRRFIGIIHQNGELPVLPTDTVVTRTPSVADILAAKNALNNINKNINKEIILFDLNSYNVKRFKQNDYKKIYSN